MLEKVKTLESKNYLGEMLSNKKVKHIIGTILLCGMGIAFPRIFHVLAGSNAGTIFLPMHIAVLISALVFGTTSSFIVAGTSVIFSYLLTGMPTLARMPYMLIELLIYAVLLSVCNKKMNPYLSLITMIVLGRILYSGVLAIAIQVLGLPTYGISVIESIKVGMPGIIIQIICIPFLVKVIKKGAKLD